MTVDEMLAHIGIQQTMARYTMAGDRLRIDEFVAVFTEDATLEAEGLTSAGHFRCDGRDAIQRWFVGWKDRSAGATPVHRATFVRHHLSTSEISFKGEGQACARTYWVAWTDIGPDHAGYYNDNFRLVGTEWLIAQRRIREDWRSSDSLFTGTVVDLNP